jgi:hypothetical protein
MLWLHGSYYLNLAASVERGTQGSGGSGKTSSRSRIQQIRRPRRQLREALQGGAVAELRRRGGAAGAG